MISSLQLMIARIQSMTKHHQHGGDLASIYHLDLLAPRAVWYTGTSVHSQNSFSGGCLVRVRRCDQTVINTLATKNGVSGDLKPLVANMPRVGTHYPESYYPSLEVWKHLSALPESLYYVGKEMGLGAVESYYRCTEDGCGLSRPTVGVTVTETTLGQCPSPEEIIYRHYPLQSDPAIAYGAVWVDEHAPLSSATATPQDTLQVSLTLTRALTHLRVGGTLICRLYYTGMVESIPLYAVLAECGNLTLHRSDATHPWNSSYYLTVEDWNPVPDWAFRLSYHPQWNGSHPTPRLNRATQKTILQSMAAWVEGVEESMKLLRVPSSRRDRTLALAEYCRRMDIPQIGKEKRKTRLDSPSSWSIQCVRGIPGPCLSRGLSLVKGTYLRGLHENALRLVEAKSVMDTIPSRLWSDKGRGGMDLATWEYVLHRRETDFSQLQAKLRQNLRGLSNAWMKMWELLSLYPHLGEGLKGSVWHICEAPGAFVSACARWREIHGMEGEWRAQTLQGGDALEDRFGLARDYPENWEYGDMTHPQTVRSYSRPSQYTLITADGGKPDHPHWVNYGELNCLPLFVGQTAAILQSLALGGSAVMKVFLPLSLPCTASILRIWTGVFASVELVKLTSSSPCNSELYLVGQDYQGCPEWTVESLLHSLPCPDAELPLVSLGEDIFHSTLLQAAVGATERQKACLVSYYRSYYYGHYPPDTRAERWKEICPSPFSPVESSRANASANAEEEVSTMEYDVGLSTEATICQKE